MAGELPAQRGPRSSKSPEFDLVHDGNSLTNSGPMRSSVDAGTWSQSPREIPVAPGPGSGTSPEFGRLLLSQQSVPTLGLRQFTFRNSMQSEFPESGVTSTPPAATRLTLPITPSPLLPGTIPILGAESQFIESGNAFFATVVALTGNRAVPPGAKDVGWRGTYALDADCRPCFYEWVIVVFRQGKRAILVVWPTPSGSAPPGQGEIPLELDKALGNFELKELDTVSLTLNIWCGEGKNCRRSVSTWFVVQPSQVAEGLEPPPSGSSPGRRPPGEGSGALDVRNPWVSGCNCSIVKVTLAPDTKGDVNGTVEVKTEGDCVECFVHVVGRLYSGGVVATTIQPAASAISLGTPPQISMIPNLRSQFNPKPGDRIVLTFTLLCVDRQNRPCVTTTTQTISA